MKHALGTMTMLAALSCAAMPPPADRVEAPGRIWMIPGIDGRPSRLAGAARALRDSGVQSQIEFFDWRRREPFGALSNLTNEQRNRNHAATIAQDIAAFRASHPDADIDLIGYSGGGGLAIMVAEALPDDVRLRHILLVQSAISPDYDLTAALGHVDGKLVNFYSRLDWLILGVGTRIFGTMDRQQVVSAGKDGFDLDRAVCDPQLRAHLEQRPWTAEMIGSGHLGGHLSIHGYYWTRQYLAPYLLTTDTP